MMNRKSLLSNSMTSAYCKKHDEVEPYDNEELWVCPKCAKENYKPVNIDEVLEKMRAEERDRLLRGRRG